MQRIGTCVMAAVLVLTGCSVPGSGGSAEPPPFVGVELPPRPFDIDVREINPCDLLTEDQQAQLGLDSPLLYSPPVQSPLYEGPDPRCTSGAFEPVSFDVGVTLAYDGLGIGALNGRPVTSEVTALDVQGFPAVQARPQDPLFCQVLVDVGPGAALSASMRQRRVGDFPQEELCAGATEVADLAMSTLLSLV